MHIRKDDMVQVMVGDDKGTRAKVLSVDRSAGKVHVEGINRVYKHVRPSQRNPQGGRLSMEMPVQLANIRLVCPRCGKPARTGVKFLDDGSKERECKACHELIGQIAPAKARRAKK